MFKAVNPTAEALLITGSKQLREAFGACKPRQILAGIETCFWAVT
jgi:hypothetical protein